jgi:O-antigen/teichoic acid export membrane protein
MKQKAYRILKWSEKYFKTDMVYVAKSGFWLSVGQVLATIFALTLSVFFANKISKEVYGNYKFILSVTGILSSLSLTGMGTVVIQAVARGAEGVLKDAVRTSLKWSVLMIGTAIGLSGYYFLNDNSTLAIALLVAGVALPLTNSFSLYGGYFSGKKDFRRGTMYWAISQGLVTLGLIIAGTLTHDVLTLIIVYFTITTGTTVYAYIHTTSKYPLNEVRDDSLVTYGKHLSLMGLFGTLANQLDKILVFHYLGAVELAIYSFSQAIPEQIKGSFKNLFNIALPKYATLPEKDLRASIVKKTIQLTGITFVIVLAYILFSPLVFKLLFPKYLESVFYSQIYILGLLAIPGISLCSTYFQLRKATKTMYKLNVISNVTTIILTFLLIYHFGLVGAVIENGVSWLIMLIINWYYFATEKIEIVTS